MKTKFALFAAVCAVVTLPMFAASYVVPEDRAFIHQVNTIVVGTAVNQTVLLKNGVWTSTTFQVDDVLNGAVFERLIDVVEPGTADGQGGRYIDGVPRFNVGERALLFLRPRPEGGWIVADLALGRFMFRRDEKGNDLLVRAAGENFGLDVRAMSSGEPHRASAAFLEFIRAEARGGHPAATYFVPSAQLARAVDTSAAPRFIPKIEIAPFAAASYTITGSPRRSTFPTPVSYNRGTVTEPGAPSGGVTAINVAMNAWSNVSGTNAKLQYSGTSVSDQGLCPSCKNDGKNTIQFERDLSWAGVAPFTCSAGGYSGVLGIGGPWTNGSIHSGPNGESFDTIIEGDVEMNQGIANCTLLFNNGDFNSAVVHEVGHSIGFRHSDQTRADNPGVACTSDPTLECSSSAIMKAFITSGLSGAPTTWDQHAVTAVYPGAVVCTPPSVSTQPVDTTINSGSSATLSVVAAGTGPFTYQWYAGATGNTNSPVNGGTGASIQVSPTATTQYWVRITGQCAPTADSNAATVTVNQGCTQTQITTQPANTQINAGSSANLTVAASGSAPFTYQWYVGTSGNTTSPVPGGTNATLSVNPSVTTSYWVQVTNSCHTATNSVTATVTVITNGCAAIQILSQPTPKSITLGQSASLTFNVTSTATPITYQWYIGTPADKSAPVPNGNTSTINVNPTTTTIYWAQATNSCQGTANSFAVQVTVNPPGCTPITMATPTVVQNGNTYTLTAAPSGGTGISVTWYVQNSGGNQQIGTGTTINVTPASTTTYIAHAANSCGATLDVPVTITITPAGTPCTAPALTQPADVTIVPGGSITLSIAATGSGTLHYQWYLGTSGNTSQALGTDHASYTTGPVPATTQYWVKVTNDCGSGASPSTASANSGTITVTVIPARRRSAHH